ncbi:MAG: nitrogen fixation/metabolism regulation signal transduction histidine kinase [Bacteriovoracaceae bacterium]|jgi:nitrogen fixation/metabolism regulation signal transduction histidine kinase
MNLSLKRRIASSFGMANIMVLLIGFTVFYYLNSLNDQIENITSNTNQISLLTDEVRISAVSILKMQKKLLTRKAKEEDLKKLNVLCDGFHSQLQRLDTFYTEVQIKTIISKMIGYVDSLQTLLSKVSIYNNRGDNGSLSAIGELSDKILEAFSEFQDIQYYQNEQRDKQLKGIIGETRRYMLIVLIITFLFTIILSLVIPGKIALPFKKINDAVRELQDCNFDVSIYYNQDDEIGELAKELNKMIASMKNFEELRTDRISVEHRKFDILANMIQKNVLIANASGELIYLNNQMYKILNMDSESVLDKKMEDTLMPNSIKEAYELALKRRSKIENSEVQISEKKTVEVENEETGEMEEKEIDEIVFNGYANVIPIRAKESDLDYYMMVLSEEIFV